MKAVKMSDNNCENKNYTLSRKLPELIVKHFFVLPEACTFF